MVLSKLQKEVKSLAKFFGIEYKDVFHFAGKINPNLLFSRKKVSLDLLEVLLYDEGASPLIDYYTLCATQNITEEFIDKHISLFLPNFEAVCQHVMLSETFMEKYCPYLVWSIISASQKLSMAFINKHQCEMPLFNLVIFQDLSEEFIKNNLDIIDNSEQMFHTLCINQNLSEKFITELEPIIDRHHVWENIFSFQNLSPDFKKKFSNKVMRIKAYVNSEFLEDGWVDIDEPFELDGLYVSNSNGLGYKISEISEDKLSIYLERL